MTTELAKAQNGISFEQMKEQANLLVKSGFLPSTIRTPEQALTIMLTGKELSLGLMESLRSINVVNGRPCMSAQLLIALCYRTKEVEQAFIKESTSLKAIYILKRKGQPEFESIFTKEEADKACFSKFWDKDKQAWKEKDNWVKQPATMLLWRSMSKAARFVFPDAICGLFTPEEIADDVDVSENPKTNEVFITEIHETQKDIIPQEVLSPKEENSALKAIDISDDQLGHWVIPFGKYKGKRLIEIIGEVTETGKAKGYEYLQWLAESATTPECKDVVTRFLKVMDDNK